MLEPERGSMSRSKQLKSERARFNLRNLIFEYCCGSQTRAPIRFRNFRLNLIKRKNQMRTRPLLAASLVCLITFAAYPQSKDEMQATFFMGRLKYSNNDGSDCSGVGDDLMKLVSSASTLKVQEERKVTLVGPELFETPFVFMNGHNEFTLTPAEVENVKKYLSHGGFIFASGCCDNPGFPKAWRREFTRIFPGEKVKLIPYDHLIYRSFHKLDRIRCLNETSDIQLEGLFYQGNLVAVMCPDGLCCAFSADNSCNRGKGISPEDGKKLALNIAIYALTH